MIEQRTDSGRESTPGRVVSLVRGSVPGLVPSEARVARFVLEEPTAVIHLSVTELATAANTSATTVMRFCQRIGFQGYQEFKIALAQEAIPPIRQLQADVIDTDSASEILAKVVSAAGEAVGGAASTSWASCATAANHANCFTHADSGAETLRDNRGHRRIRCTS